MSRFCVLIYIYVVVYDFQIFLLNRNIILSDCLVSESRVPGN